jgi:hypothetical protein
MVPRSADDDAPGLDPFDQLSGSVPGGHASESVTVQLWWPAPGFMASRVLGHLDVAAARFLASSLQEHGARSATARLVGFHDWSRMTDYDSDARVLLTAATGATIGHSDGIHLLVQSPLVAFDIRTAGVALTNVFVYSARGAFERRLASTLRRVSNAPAGGGDVGELRSKACSGCGAGQPDDVGTAYSLIDHGWRLSRPSGTEKRQWFCPACWRERKKPSAQ